MANGINVLMSLTDKFTNPLNNIAKKTKQAERQFKSAANVVGKFGQSMNNAVMGAAGSVVKLGVGLAALTVGGAVVKLKDLAVESMNLAAAQSRADTELDTILKNVTSIADRGADAYKKAGQNLRNYASELQSLGVVGDEVTLSGMAQLATFQMNMRVKTIE